MKIYHQFENAIPQGRKIALTIGKFDGFHLGHQKLVRQVISYKAEGLLAVVLRFVRAEGEDRQNALLGAEERYALLEKWGVDILLEIPFREAIRNLPAETFLKTILCETLHMQALVVGTDFALGQGRRGDVSFLKAHESCCHYHLDILEKEWDRQAVPPREISSSYIRELKAQGHWQHAACLLGHGEK